MKYTPPSIARLCLVGLALCIAPAAMAAGAPYASFDTPVKTSLRANPTLVGTAGNLAAPLVLTVVDSRRVPVTTILPTVSGGRWFATLYPPLATGTYTTQLSSGGTSLVQGKLAVGLATAPTVVPDGSLGSYDVSDGKLMRFKLTTGARVASVAQLTFYIKPESADITTALLYGFKDKAYTQPIIGGSDGTLATADVASSSVVTIAFNEPLELAAHHTYYFELDADVSPTSDNYSVSTVLLGDSYISEAASVAQLASSSIVWSPDTFGFAGVDDGDWFSGASLGLLPPGLSETRHEQPVAGGLYAPAAGPKQVAAQATSTGTGTSTPTATLTPDTLLASSTSGKAPFTTVLGGIVNASSSCAALTYTLGFGDNSTSTIVVAKNACKPQWYSFSHRYASVGTYTAALYLGQFAKGTTTPLVAKLTINAKLTYVPQSMFANVLSAFDDAWRILKSWLQRIF